MVSVADLVDSAITYLMYEHDIEIIRGRKPADFAEYLQTLTRLIADRRESEFVTEIDCVAKYVIYSIITHTLLHSKYAVVYFYIFPLFISICFSLLYVCSGEFRAFKEKVPEGLTAQEKELFEVRH
jgi:hypothetical protein